VKWIYLAQDVVKLQAVVDTVMNFQVPWSARCFVTGCAAVSHGLGQSGSHLVTVPRI
jgi:hypothetical protein